MSGGAFLKEQKKAPANKSPVKMPVEERRAARARRIRRRKQQRRMLIMTIVVLSAILIGMLLWLNSSPLVGKWSMDDVTSYRFDRNGKGAMILPTAEYEFTYTVEQDILYIDFVHEGAKDAEYSFETSGDILTLIGGNATTKGVYTLTKGE